MHPYLVYCNGSHLGKCRSVTFFTPTSHNYDNLYFPFVEIKWTQIVCGTAEIAYHCDKIFIERHDSNSTNSSETDLV